MSNQYPPAQLITGDKNILDAHVEELLQKQFCTTKTAGCFCHECRKIKNRQHSCIVWISPTKDYTVDDVDIIFERARFALDPGQQFFFILDNVQTLNAATANRLLKILEEPPVGYHFILLTTNAEAILPTIASRCVVVELASNTDTTSSYTLHPLLSFFLNPEKLDDPITFEAELKKQHLSDTQSVELLQQLVAAYTQKIRDCALNHKQENMEQFSHVLDFLIKKMRKPPQSGSSELFWKHLFLMFPR
jgi:DNA polymerase-3 subunit delta'